MVTVGINPLCKEWMPDPARLIDRLKALGVWGVWVQVPYFGKSFRDNLSPAATERLRPEFVRQCGERGNPDDRRHAQAAMAYARAAGLEVFSTEYEEPTKFFDPWHKLYKRPMPYWHQLVNAVDPMLDGCGDDEYVIVTRDQAEATLVPLPELDWSEVLRHKRAKRYREIVTPLPDGRLPKLSVKALWDIMWNDEVFCKSLGLTSFRRFAQACVIENNTIVPLTDENGDRLLLYRRQPWPYTFAEAPELA